jgi:hypothetical protein
MNIAALAPFTAAVGSAQALLRLDRLQTGVTTTFMVDFAPNQVSGLNKVQLTLPAGFSLGGANVSTSGLDPGVTPLPGGLSATISGNTLTISGITSLVSGVLYGFTGGNITNPAVGSYVASFATLNGNTLLEQTSLGLSILSSDQVGTGGSNAPPPANKCVKDDFNGDHKVNIFDLSILLSHFGKATSIGDLNNDGIVNIFDLSIFLNCFGASA